MKIKTVSSMSDRVHISDIPDYVEGKQKPGIAVHNRIWGWILSLFGWAIQLKDDQQKSFYINRRSAIKWLNRHHIFLGDSTPAKKVADKIYEFARQFQPELNSSFKTHLNDIRSNLKQAGNNSSLSMESKDGAIVRSDSAMLSSTNEIIVAAQLHAFKQLNIGKDSITIAHVGNGNSYLDNVYNEITKVKKVVKTEIDSALSGSVDVILAPHTLYSEMDSIFKASEGLLSREYPLTVEEHPLFKYFDKLSEGGSFIVTLTSGPNIEAMTDLMLGKHMLDLSQVDRASSINLKIFNTVETFFRCLEVFKKKYEEKMGKTIDCDLSFSLPHIPLAKYCEEYVRRYPELAKFSSEQREKFVRLLSVFNVNKEIVNLDITLTLSVKEKPSYRSFKTVQADLDKQKQTVVKDGSNDISLGQQNLDKQIQNLNGSELSMPYIKDADGAAQFKAFRSLLNRRTINLLDIGGGRGETNAVPKAIVDAGVQINLLNVEPHVPFAQLYIDAHRSVGIENTHVLQKNAQQLLVSDVMHHFNGKKVDALFASHSLYFLLGDLHKFSQEYAYGDTSTQLSSHPLWKYFSLMSEEGVFTITMQTGAGARLIRNALLGNHGLEPSAQNNDETTSLLSSFGNLAALLRHFELFAKLYEKHTGNAIQIKMHHAVASVPLGEFKIEQDLETGGYLIRNPNGSDGDPEWLAPKMFDFYGNWKELETLATLTLEKAQKMSKDDLKKIGLENLTSEKLASKREVAQKNQKTFLNILRVFALGEQNMQHPNITLEVRIKK